VERPEEPPPVVDKRKSLPDDEDAACEEIPSGLECERGAADECTAEYPERHATEAAGAYR
jgi:hypothetical protein